MLEYTSRNTADLLVSRSMIENPASVVDFCAGGGSLLESAYSRWPNARFYANDIVPAMRGSFDQADWINVDFMNGGFEKVSRKRFPKKYDVVLLNPPFAFERTQWHRARGKFSQIRSSIAFAFLFTALEYLSEHGELLAVLPTSTLKSDRDFEARRQLKKFFNCNVISPPVYDRFPGLDVSSYLLSVRNKRGSNKPTAPIATRDKSQAAWMVTRGKISVRRADRKPQLGLHGWIHTTSIQRSTVVERYELPSGMRAKDVCVLARNALVIPRVGRVKQTDVLVTKRREILSDCLIGVTFSDPRLPLALLKKIKADFSSFAPIYAGTGAPYTTCSRISDFVEYSLKDIQLPIEGIATVR